MKKCLLILVFALASIVAFAKSPNLHVEKIFDGSYVSNPSVSLNVSRTPQTYFRGCTVTENASLVKEITKLFEKDLPKAERSQDLSSYGSQYRSMVIINNDEEIYIGLSFDDKNGCYLFIKGSPSAFK